LFDTARSKPPLQHADSIESAKSFESGMLLEDFVSAAGQVRGGTWNLAQDNTRSGPEVERKDQVKERIALREEAARERAAVKEAKDKTSRRADDKGVDARKTTKESPLEQWGHRPGVAKPGSPDQKHVSPKKRDDEAFFQPLKKTDSRDPSERWELWGTGGRAFEEGDYSVSGGRKDSSGRKTPSTSRSTASAADPASLMGSGTLTANAVGFGKTFGANKD
jgi:hypothetical protein